MDTLSKTTGIVDTSPESIRAVLAVVRQLPPKTVVVLVAAEDEGQMRKDLQGLPVRVSPELEKGELIDVRADGSWIVHSTVSALVPVPAEFSTSFRLRWLSEMERFASRLATPGATRSGNSDPESAAP